MGPGPQHLSSRLPWDCFPSTEEPKLARDKGAAFPQLRGWGGGCSGCHLLESQVSSSAETWSEEERAGEGWGNGTPRFGGFLMSFKASALLWGLHRETGRGPRSIPPPQLTHRGHSESPSLSLAHKPQVAASRSGAVLSGATWALDTTELLGWEGSGWKSMG